MDGCVGGHYLECVFFFPLSLVKTKRTTSNFVPPKIHMNDMTIKSNHSSRYTYIPVPWILWEKVLVESNTAVEVTNPPLGTT